MADTVNTQILRNDGDWYVVRLTNESDGTGESNVVKVDISGLTNTNSKTVTYTSVYYIEYSVNVFNYVVLRWDHTTDDEIAVLRGTGCIDLRSVGGQVDPKTTGGTGDILLTTDGLTDGASYDITLHLRKKV